MTLQALSDLDSPAYTDYPRLLEKPEDFNNRDLVVANGVSVDKIMAHERRDDEGGNALVSEFERLAAKLAESGASMEIKVAPRPSDPTDDAIDVTPPRARHRL